MELEKGDFLYQVDQELFLVVTDISKKSYTFSVHGWRTIDKERIDQYLDDPKSNIHHMDTVQSVIRNEGSQSMKEEYEELRAMFEDVYGSSDLTFGESFSMEDTDGSNE